MHVAADRGGRTATFTAECTGPDEWDVIEGGARQPVLAPTEPVIEARARALGEDTAAVLAEL
jgi:hypothetical protein